ncbi:MAG: hypothetical protein ABW019_16305 [Chitinophagaceae bacterium]
MKKRFLLLPFALLSALVLFYACQKEVSFENGGIPSVGMLQSDISGDCLPKTVTGIYEEGTALATTTNYIDVEVDVLVAGSYTIYTDTVNGMYFRATGVFATTGINTVRLAGYGTPVADGIFNFVVTYGLTECTVPVTVLPDGATSPAVFVLSTGTGGECMGAVVSGTYTAGTAVTSANQVVINVNVTTPGTYTLSTTATNGISFSGTGSLPATGAATITLTATGTPGTTGTTNIPVTVGASSCSFPVTVTGPATYTVNCGTASVQGTYTQGVALGAGNTVNIGVTVTTIGGYTITGTVSNMTFSHSGTFTTTGPQTITLAGTGTPSASGTLNVQVNSGSTPCTFPVTVNPGTPAANDYYPRTTGSNWSYQFDGDFNDSILVKVIPETKTAFGNIFNIFMATDDASAGFDTSGYYRKAGGVYSRFTNLAGYLSFDDDQWVEFTFLKDDQAAGHTWTTAAWSGTIGGTPVSVRIKFTVVQKDVTVTVGSTSYSNTIVIEERYEANLGFGWVDATPVFGYYKDYYARNIGWLYDEIFDENDDSMGRMDIRRYAILP